MRSIACEVGTSFGAVQAFLTDILGMSKISARWVLRMLSNDQKRTRLSPVSLKMIPTILSSDL